MQLQLEAIEGLDFDFSSIFSSAGKALQSAAPQLINAAVQKQVQKIQAKGTAPAATGAVSVNTLAPVQQSVTQRPASNKKYFLIGGGLLLGGGLLYVALR